MRTDRAIVHPGREQLTARADVRVSVPLIGGKIEGVVGEQVRRLLVAETAFTDEWLAQNGR